MEDFNQNKALETLGTMPHELFNRRISLIGSPEAIEKLKSGHWHIERHCLYTTVDVGSEVEIDNMFSEQPTKGTNIINSQVPDFYMLLTEIRLRLYRSEYNHLSSLDLLTECGLGEFTFKQQGTTYFENCPFSIFDNGKLIMSPPKMLYPNRKLEFSCKWNEVLGCGTMLKVELHGIRTLDALK